MSLLVALVGEMFVCSFVAWMVQFARVCLSVCVSLCVYLFVSVYILCLHLFVCVYVCLLVALVDEILFVRLWRGWYGWFFVCA